MTQQKHVFVSYAHEDKAFADWLNKSLQESKQIPWQDRTDIKPGDNYQEKIDKAIRNAEALMVVMSPHATRSQYVTYEWAFALGAGVRVIPVIVKKRTTLHPRLATIQHIDLTTRSGSPWVDLFTALPTLPATTTAGPEIRAKFNLVHGKPEQRGDYYVIDVYIGDAPKGANQVTYEFRDETLKTAKWPSKSAASEFRSEILSNGDSLLTATIRIPGKKPLRIACPLYEALKLGHGPHPKPEIKKALRKIGETRTTN
jgi:hypothetical protein